MPFEPPVLPNPVLELVLWNFGHGAVV